MLNSFSRGKKVLAFVEKDWKTWKYLRSREMINGVWVETYLWQARFPPKHRKPGGGSQPPDTGLQVSGHGEGSSLLCRILNYLGRRELTPLPSTASSFTQIKPQGLHLETTSYKNLTLTISDLIASLSPVRGEAPAKATMSTAQEKPDSHGKRR